MSETQAIVKRNDGGITVREDFVGGEIVKTAETAMASVKAREEARISAQYLMAERHPRSWDTVRVRLLNHCDRPGFAEVARYKKPVGRKQINGMWVECFAEGMSARFAEVARQEMANTNTESSVVYEDDLLRIVRASVIDLERNTIESRELAIPKVMEKRGRQKKNSEEWLPPEGREVIKQRFNSYGEPVYLCRATDDEVTQKQNSLISKTTRDASLRLIPKDIRDDCERRVVETLNDPKKTDPTVARKRVIDSFAKIGVLPDDLLTYIGTSMDRLSPAQLDELRGLYNAVQSGEVSFNEALKLKFDTPKNPEDETREQQDARLQRQMNKQRETAQETAKPRRGRPPKTEQVSTVDSGPSHAPPAADTGIAQEEHFAQPQARNSEIEDEGFRKQINYYMDTAWSKAQKVINEICGNKQFDELTIAEREGLLMKLKLACEAGT